MSVGERDPKVPGEATPPPDPEDRGARSGPAGPGGPSQGRDRLVPPIAYPILALLFGGALVWSFSRILLAISDHTIKIGSLHVDGKKATAAIALLMALNVLVGAALVAYGGRVRRRPASYPLLLGAGLVLIAGGVTATTIGAPPAAAKVQTVNLVAQGVAFQQKTLSFATGGEVAVVFDNKDASIQHNFVLFNGKDASAPVLFSGQVITGPAVTRYTFTAPPTGNYFFHCEIHPTQMTGIVTVTAAGGGGATPGAPGALQLTGRTLAGVAQFSPTTLTASSGSQVTIHFTNADPSTPHNVVVFNGKDATAPALFTGQAVTGPASIDYTFPAPPPGTYFFHCQFHPTTMKGTLVIR